MTKVLPKAGDVVILWDKPDWSNFTEGKGYTLLSDCVQERWGEWFSPEVKAHVLDDVGAEKRINLIRFKGWEY
jgi:hypothetical protein